MDDDATLLRSYVETRSQAAFAELVNRHLRTVYAVALRGVGGDPHLAQEVAQQVFADLARKAAALRHRPVLGGWLFLAARFTAAKAVRAERQHRGMLARAAALMTMDSDILISASSKELSSTLDAALHLLGDRDREALMLRFFESKSFAEIGAQLRLSSNTARMRVDRALDRLRELLERRGIRSTAAALAVGLSAQTAVALPPQLASAVTAAGLAAVSLPAASLALSLMAITKTHLTIALAVAILGTVWISESASRRAEQLTSQNSIIARQLEAERRKVAALNQQLANSAAKIAANSARPAGHIPVTVTPGSDVAVIHLKQVEAEHPEIKPLLEIEHQRGIMRTYGSAIALLHLPPEKSAQLIHLLNERGASAQDASDLAEQAGAKSNSPELRQAIQQAVQPIEEQIIGLIGKSSWDTVQANQGMYSTSNAVSDYSADLDGAGLPLTPDQLQGLAQAFFATKYQPNSIRTGMTDATRLDPQTWMSVSDQAVLQQAAVVLSPSQMEVFRATITEKNHYNAILAPYQKGGHGAVIMTN